MSHVIIEADTPNNANLRLGRLDVTLRGRLSCSRGSRQTLAALGPVGRVEPFERLSARLAAGPG